MNLKDKAALEVVGRLSLMLRHGLVPLVIGALNLVGFMSIPRP